jgi:hypothetical protein
VRFVTAAARRLKAPEDDILARCVVQDGLVVELDAEL